jgi:hypothetical protein
LQESANGTHKFTFYPDAHTIHSSPELELDATLSPPSPPPTSATIQDSNPVALADKIIEKIETAKGGKKKAEVKRYSSESIYCTFKEGVSFGLYK